MPKLSAEQFEAKYGADLARGIQPQTPQEAPQDAPDEQKRGLLGKIAGFVAPTATGSFEKLKAGEKLTARDIIGSALEIGSFLIPVGATVRGLGLAGKGALLLGRRIAFGAAAGAVSGATFEAGRTIGQPGTGVKEIFEATAAGATIGGALGGFLPAGLAGVRAIPRTARALPQAIQTAKRGAQAVGRGAVTGAKVTGEVAESVVTTVGKRIPEKIGQFAERRAERAARLKGKPIHVQEAVRKNIEQPIIDFIRVANKTDKIQRIKMLDVALKGKTNLSFRGQAKQIPGRTIVKGPVAHLIKVKDAAVRQTNEVLDGLSSKKQNARPLFDEFIQDMNGLGLTQSKNRLVITRGSKVPEGDLKFYQQVFNELKPNKKGVTPLTFRQMHQIRQKFFEVAKTDATFTSGPTNYARRLRSFVGDPINKASNGAYINAQNTTREALEGLQEFVKLIGFKGRLEDISTKDLKAGEVFLRVFGNAADRPTSVLDKIYDTARGFGYKGQENIFDQLRFADILENVYGSPTRALSAKIGRAAQDPLAEGLGVAREAAKWSPTGAALKLVKSFLGNTPEDILKAFENLIRKEGGQKVRTTFGRPSTLGGVAKGIKKQAEPLVKEVKTRAGAFSKK